MEDRYIELNRAEYKDKYDLINFCTESAAEIFESERKELTERISEKVSWGYNHTKTDCSNLSEGCRLCGAGVWSCLFINGLCNANCFYCPASQDDVFKPTTNSVSFDSPHEYVEYIREFGFKGVSISGGEPLLTPELTLSYISAVRKAFGSDIYIWMYTNGILITEEMVSKLMNAGLDELRFDIGATGYKLDKIQMAIGEIPVVTVEIPAVPEEYEQMKDTVRKLADMGVNHLNLHQLRLTPYNFEKLMQRNYTFIHNESVTVIESELTALKLIHHTVENGINLPVNYCSYPYKNRYQGMASRRLSCSYMVKQFEEITENCYIRLISLKGYPEDIEKLIHEKDSSKYELNREKNNVSIHRDLLADTDLSAFEITVKYFSARQLPHVSYRNPFNTIKLTDNKNIIIERFRVSEDIVLKGSDYAQIFNGALPEINRFELIPDGLLEYI